MEWKLSILRGAATGSEVPLRRLPFTIGRTRDCDIVEPDGHVSRRHCQLAVNEGALFVLDCGSRNGVFVNGERVEGSRQVQAGDCIRVGSAVYCVGCTERKPTDVEETQIEPEGVAKSLSFTCTA